MFLTWLRTLCGRISVTQSVVTRRRSLYGRTPALESVVAFVASGREQAGSVEARANSVGEVRAQWNMSI